MCSQRSFVLSLMQLFPTLGFNRIFKSKNSKIDFQILNPLTYSRMPRCIELLLIKKDNGWTYWYVLKQDGLISWFSSKDNEFICYIYSSFWPKCLSVTSEYYKLCSYFLNYNHRIQRWPLWKSGTSNLKKVLITVLTFFPYTLFLVRVNDDSNLNCVVPSAIWSATSQRFL